MHVMPSDEHDTRDVPVRASPLLKRWLTCVGADVDAAAAAATAMPSRQWLVGPAALQGSGAGATFRRLGEGLEANFTHNGINYATLGAHVVIVVPAILPATVAIAAAGRRLADVVDTPITRHEYATIVSVTSLAAAGGKTIVVATCPTEPLANP